MAPGGENGPEKHTREGKPATSIGGKPEFGVVRI